MHDPAPAPPSSMYVQPCVHGNSSTGLSFNFSIPVNATRNSGLGVISPISLCLAGNLGFIIALTYLHTYRKKNFNQGNLFYLLLTTLLWKNMIGTLITTVQPVLTYLQGNRWVGGVPACSTHGFFMSTIGLMTHTLTALMGLNRYLALVAYPMNTKADVIRRRTKLFIVFSLVFSVLYCSLPFLGVGRFRLHFPGTWCHINMHICWDEPWTSIVYGNVYTIINLTCMALLIYFNVAVLGTLLKKKEVTRFQGKSRELKMVVLLVLITISFTASWITHDLLIPMHQIWPVSPDTDPEIDRIAIRVVAFNQILEPWLYVICRLIFSSTRWKKFSHSVTRRTSKVIENRRSSSKLRTQRSTLAASVSQKHEASELCDCGRDPYSDKGSSREDSLERSQREITMHTSLDR